MLMNHGKKKPSTSCQVQREFPLWGKKILGNWPWLLARGLNFLPCGSLSIQLLEYPHNTAAGLPQTDQRVMLKIFQVRLQQYVNRELPVGQAGFRKGRGTRDQIANICWKTIYFGFIDYAMPLTVWITINCGKL